MNTSKKYYAIDEFNGLCNECADTLADIIDKKLALLHDFGILTYGDDRSDAVKELLGQCANEVQIDNILHDVLVGNTTLDKMLGGYVQ